MFKKPIVPIGKSSVNPRHFFPPNSMPTSETLIIGIASTPSSNPNRTPAPTLEYIAKCLWLNQ